MVTLSLLTKEDLQDFKKELLQDITSLFENNISVQKQWLRTSEVKKLLNVSAGTLQNYRINGTLSYKKLGGSLYYSYDEIQKLMQSK
ncbi:helix-turn-helix domain-containing protein [Chryseobacterium wangxinyae]|uniref:helix-turn-helix domain-containing protein n=1 Tax=Chryseobacterium sp. CY353 TaxID=2997334 RepID=UPI0022719A01|nr:helix-turn-helix domain-containing protein [Chryseobacterium sp. CY353]MCY0969900.1 helix-turn-helix domain-containing protein [Chryseobacterium sp. CY353]MCY0970944.1 helix-turn-helix domain-containing protein [Chryseobacterium sp. CY353]